jgi:uncharacterized protein
MTFRSALYVGSVVHRRLRPRAHRLRYRLFWMLVDLDEIDTLADGLRLFSRNRFNAVSFYDADFGDGSGAPLRPQVERHLAKADIALDGGKISLLCMPRIFGYGFNPLSVYFCYSKIGALVAILYEVHNTFGERHSYLIAVDNPVNNARTVIAQQCRKVFHVSPFMDMDMTYQFRVAAPAERIAVAISAAKTEGVQMFAALAGRRRDVSDAALLRLLASHPLLTLKVVGAIHWHALRLLLKGIKLRRHPAPPYAPVTTVPSKIASSMP